MNMISNGHAQGKNDIGSRCVHGGLAPDPFTGALVPPLVQSTTYAWSDLDHPPTYTYARVGSPTVHALEERLAALEGGATAIAFGSGLAATDALFRTLPRNARVVAGRHLYGGTTRLLQRFYAHHTIEFVDTTDSEVVADALASPADLVLVETPSNPTLLITDLRAVGKAAKEAGALFVVDNTFLTAVAQRPLELAADVVLYSTTKYIEGHNATLGGALVLPEEHDGNGATPEGPLAPRLRWIRKCTGAPLAPFEAWLTLQGIKTLHLRTRDQFATAGRIAREVRTHGAISHTYYPGLPDHPGHGVHRGQAIGDGGIVALDLDTFAAAKRFTSELRVFSIAEQLGATESIVTYPAMMTHADLPPDRRRADGITDGLVRLSVGVEGPEVLLDDVVRALDAVAQRTEVAA